MGKGSAWFWEREKILFERHISITSEATDDICWCTHYHFIPRDDAGVYFHQPQINKSNRGKSTGPFGSLDVCSIMQGHDDIKKRGG